jgi:hypothetical protein
MERLTSCTAWPTGLGLPVLAAGVAVGAVGELEPLARALARLRPLKPHSARPLRMTWMACGFWLLRKAIAAAAPGLLRFLPRSTRMRRMRMVTSP